MQDVKMWYVEVREYAGEGYWYNYPPFEFDTLAEANEFAEKMSEYTKVRVFQEATKN